MPEALPYHLKLCKHFKEQKKTWDFFASVDTRNEQLNKFRLELLKNTYKFDPGADNGIYEKVMAAKEKLGLAHLPVHVYQAQFAEEVNASIVYLDNEAHIVFSGRITQLLGDDELLAVIAHELTHVKLYTMLGGDLEIADRIITAIANNHNSEPAYFETARLYRLYTEIFCDRGAYSVIGKTGPVITSLVKVATGLEKVSAESYIKQAVEIFAAEKELKTDSVSHPENFIRARAIQLWHDMGEASEAEIISMIEGITDIDQLDIFRQKELADMTRRFLQVYLKPKWFQTVMVMSQAKQFFPDFSLDENALLTQSMINSIGQAHSSVKEYLCYVLLDFALADSNLDAVPFGWAFQLAEDVQLKDTFDAIVKKEFAMGDKKLQQHKQKCLAAFYEVKEGATDQVYED